jgi:hypothetical protein
VGVVREEEGEGAGEKGDGRRKREDGRGLMSEG